MLDEPVVVATTGTASGDGVAAGRRREADDGGGSGAVVRLPMRRRVALFVALVAAPLGMARSAQADAAEGVVVGTPAAEVRGCPEPTCPVLGKAPLGSEVVIAGEPAGGVVPVVVGAVRGYALAPFIAADPAAPPVFAAGAPGCQRVALIFNVGVGYPPATSILDTLEAERVPATMFVMGWWAEQRPAALQRMVDLGFPIASHGYASTELTLRPDDEVVADVTKAALAIERATGQPPAPYFTPYAAAIDDRVRAIVAAQGVLPVAWEVPAADYGEDATEASVYARVMDNIYDGAIVELHLDGPASAESTGRALPRIIADLSAQGYRFVTIPEMIQPC